MAVRVADLPVAVRAVLRHERRALDAALTWVHERGAARRERRAVYRAMRAAEDGRATGARV